ncbi:hypothetical protein ACFL2Z_00260 [Candidatus Eisenbacteria bacterium]|uniref:Uncharacterized protein n=1 Tax=Eiseniibacteriota bacterium TaxID=2212470 RepID=A0ABV6YN39_UNCEI
MGVMLVSKWMCVVLIVVLAVSAAFFARRWQTLARGTVEDQSTREVLEQENAQLQGVLDSLMAAISPGGQPELNAGFWYTQARRAKENQSMLLWDHEIRELQERGLDDPVNDLRDDLVAHPELIPYDGVSGGTMYFVRHRISLLSLKWVYAEFEDGHIAGRCLLEYDVTPEGNITWSVIESELH